MRTVHFDFNGADRTLGEIFLGHGLVVTVYLLGSALVAWTVAGVERERWPTVAPIAWGLALAQVATACIAGRYFFAGPAVLTGLAALLLLAGNTRASLTGATGSATR
jgi:hypothetical protein